MELNRKFVFAVLLCAVPTLLYFVADGVSADDSDSGSRERIRLPSYMRVLQGHEVESKERTFDSLYSKPRPYYIILVELAIDIKYSQPQNFASKREMSDLLTKIKRAFLEKYSEDEVWLDLDFGHLKTIEEKEELWLGSVDNARITPHYTDSIFRAAVSLKALQKITNDENVCTIIAVDRSPYLIGFKIMGRQVLGDIINTLLEESDVNKIMDDYGLRCPDGSKNNRGKAILSCIQMSAADEFENHGPFVRFSSTTGKIIEKGFYEKGEKSGLWEYYNESGEFIRNEQH